MCSTMVIVLFAGVPEKAYYYVRASSGWVACSEAGQGSNTQNQLTFTANRSIRSVECSSAVVWLSGSRRTTKRGP